MVRFFGRRLRKLEGFDPFRVLVGDCLFLDLFCKFTKLALPCYIWSIE